MKEPTLAALTNDYPVTAEQCAQFRDAGHVLIPGILSPAELPGWRNTILETVTQHNTETRPLSERDTHGKAFLQTFNLWTLAPDTRHFVLARRFAKIAADLMGVGAVRVYHDQALFKEPGGGLTPWHQDQYYWPLDTDNIVTMWMPLVDVSKEMGSLKFATESHKKRDLGSLNLSDESQDYFDQVVKEHGFTINQYTLQGGDATFHSGWTLHCAPGNNTDRTREVMTVIYYSASAHVTPPSNPHHQVDIDKWMPGLKPGDLAASKLNPLVYAKS